MRIALLTSAKGWRGSGASYAKLAAGLAARGHRAQLVTAAGRLSDRFRHEGLEVTEIPGRNTGGREVWALLQTLRRLAAQAVIVDTPRDLRLAAWATLVHPARIVYRYNLNYRRPRNDLADRVYARRVSACIYQSRFIQEDALLHEPWVLRVRGYRVPNGYDSDRFAPRPEAGIALRHFWEIPPGAHVVLTSAKLERGKGHDVALAALHQLRQRGLAIAYVVCGDGVLEPELRALAARYSLPVRFTGLLDIDALVAALSAADLVVHPSMREIFPNAVGEAMACARAVVAVDAGGTGELLGTDGMTGVLVPAKDPAAMASAVAQMLDDAPRRARIGSAARTRIQTVFSLRRMIDGYEAALQEMISHP
jgi:glycosyltransferase involved in cell wall biosynthesis